MNWWLAYQIAVGVGLALALAWAYDARRLLAKAARLVELHDDQPTQEIPMLSTAKIAPRPHKPPPAFRLEDLGGPSRPLPPYQWPPL